MNPITATDIGSNIASKEQVQHKHNAHVHTDTLIAHEWDSA